MAKFFVIGFNRCGTTSLHHLFRYNGLRSQHSASYWNVLKYDCFSDCGETRHWKWYARIYPDAVFILNTRPLVDWLASRSVYCIARYKACSWCFDSVLKYMGVVLRGGYPSGIDQSAWLMKQVMRRQRHYLDLLSFFEHRPGQLLIADISRDGWIGFIAQELGLEPNEVVANSGDSKGQIDYIRQRLQGLGLNEGHMGSALLVEPLMSAAQRLRYQALVSLYANNLKM